MAHVFLSYDREDRDFAEVVQAKLERAGHETSMDLDILNAGDDWQTTLDLAIRRSDAIVVIMAPEARASDYVAYEWAFAFGAGVKVIPVELRTTAFPPRLDGLHRLDFTGKNRPWEMLLAEVARAEVRGPVSSIAVDPSTPATVKQAVRAIDSLVSEERRAAVSSLAQTDHPTALDALTRALEHPVREVRAAAATMFPDRTNPKIVQGLIEAYVDDVEKWSSRSGYGDPPFPQLLFEAVDRLGGSAAPALVNALKRLDLEPKHSHVRHVMLQALGKTKSAAALSALQEALKDKRSWIRDGAADALGKLGEPGAAAALRSALADPEESVRGYAARSLGLLKDGGAVSDLIGLLHEDVTGVRVTAAAALGRIGDPSALAALLAALRDEEGSGVKEIVIEALGRLGDAAAIPHLRALLDQHGPDPVTRIEHLDYAVMVALVRLRDTESFAAIADRLVRFEGGVSFDSGPEPLHQELARQGAEGVQVLVRVLSGASHPSVQSAAAKALECVAMPEVTKVLKAWKRKR